MIEGWLDRLAPTGEAGPGLALGPSLLIGPTRAT